ncbi:MAG: hypothetical protein Q7S05_02150 [bacterium]|nr:hypothetical protein [bacterium]
MGFVVPAVLPASSEDLEAKLALLAPLSAVTVVQIDVVDGRFASPATWPYESGAAGFASLIAEGNMLPGFDRFRYDIDLMVADPESVIGSWIAAGASRLTVHVESTSYLPKIITDFKQKFGHDTGFMTDALSFGLAIGIETDLAVLEQYLGHVDYVQFMGIAKIGRQRQPFDERVLRKIKTFRSRHPKTTIQVDGGVSLTSAPRLLEAGVDRLIIGSALFKAKDLSGEVKKFEALKEMYGVFE